MRRRCPCITRRLKNVGRRPGLVLWKAPDADKPVLSSKQRNQLWNLAGAAAVALHRPRHAGPPRRWWRRWPPAARTGQTAARTLRPATVPTEAIPAVTLPGSDFRCGQAAPGPPSLVAGQGSRCGDRWDRWDRWGQWPRGATGLQVTLQGRGRMAQLRGRGALITRQTCGALTREAPGPMASAARARAKASGGTAKAPLSAVHGDFASSLPNSSLLRELPARTPPWKPARRRRQLQMVWLPPTALARSMSGSRSQRLKRP